MISKICDIKKKENFILSAGLRGIWRDYAGLRGFTRDLAGLRGIWRDYAGFGGITRDLAGLAGLAGLGVAPRLIKILLMNLDSIINYCFFLVLYREH